MPDPVTGLVVGGTSLAGGLIQSRSAGKAADAQVRASEASIAEQRRQFDAIQELLAPYIESGTGALGAQEALLGLEGPRAQRDAIAALEDSPQFEALVSQGEESILQNAAATGGLRGGNVQSALAEFRPQLLSQLIESQYSKLGGLSQLGQASATGQAAAGQQSANAISNLLTQQGQARAGEQIARGQAFAQPLQLAGQFATLNALGAF